MIEKIHVALIRTNLSDDYNRHTATTMMSVLDNCSLPVVFHILHEEKNSFLNKPEADNNIDKFHKMVVKHNSEVIFHNVVIPEWINYNNIPSMKRFTTAIFYRFYLPEVLPPEIKKVICLGSDVIVKTDLAKMLKTIPDNFSLAGARLADEYIDTWKSLSLKQKNYKRYRQILDKEGIDISDYVNADFLIFNLDKIREEKTLPGPALEYLEKHPDISGLDQDILNILYKGDIYYLDSRYNIVVGGYNHWREKLSVRTNPNEETDYILHYCNRPKPWVVYNDDIDFEYWHYLYHTPWCDDKRLFKKYLSDALVSPNDVIENIDKWIWELPLHKKIKTIYEFTFPLWFKIIKRYIS